MPWLLYHTDELTDIVQTQRSTIKIIKRKGDDEFNRNLNNEVFNALFDDEDDELKGDGFERWRFNCHNVSMVGLTTKSEFAKGHKLRAFSFFSLGKFGDGSYTPVNSEVDNMFNIKTSLTTADYGSPWPEVTEILLIIHRSSDSFKLSAVQDKRSLGLAYDLDLPISEKLYPVVRFSKPGEVSVFKMDIHLNEPSLTQRDPEIFNGQQGFWSITQYGHRKTVKPYPVRLFKLDNDQFDLHVKVNDIISARLTQSPVGYRVDKTFKNSSPGDANIIKDEYFILECIASISDIKFGKDENTLIMENTRGNMVLKRFCPPAPEPIRSCPLRRLIMFQVRSSEKGNCCDTV